MSDYCFVWMFLYSLSVLLFIRVRSILYDIIYVMSRVSHYCNVRVLSEVFECLIRYGYISYYKFSFI